MGTLFLTSRAVSSQRNHGRGRGRPGRRKKRRRKRRSKLASHVAKQLAIFAPKNIPDWVLLQTFLGIFRCSKDKMAVHFYLKTILDHSLSCKKQNQHQSWYGS